MSDEFLKALVPEWDSMPDDEKAALRGQLNALLDGPMNPVKNPPKDYGTPNWCPKCSPQGLGYCRCEIASNE